MPEFCYWLNTSCVNNAILYYKEFVKEERIVRFINEQPTEAFEDIYDNKNGNFNEEEFLKIVEATISILCWEKNIITMEDLGSPMSRPSPSVYEIHSNFPQAKRTHIDVVDFVRKHVDRRAKEVNYIE